jgi:hypothetical protein
MIGDDISFNIGIMTEGTRKAVRKYLDTLLMDATSGKIDPFERAFGVKARGVKIQERGIYWREAAVERAAPVESPSCDVPDGE